MNENKLDLILNELQEMKQEQHEMKQDIQGIKQELHEVKQDQLNMKSQMNSRFDTIETILTLHGEKFIVIERKMDDVQGQVTNNAENIEVVKKGQLQTEGTIDLLARRSLDQEATIKRINV